MASHWSIFALGTHVVFFVWFSCSCSSFLHSLNSWWWTLEIGVWHCHAFAFLISMEWSDFVGLCPPCYSVFTWLTLCLSFLLFTVFECFALSSFHWTLRIGSLRSFAWIEACSLFWSHDDFGPDSRSLCLIVLHDILIWFLLDLWSVISIVSLDLLLGLLTHLLTCMLVVYWGTMWSEGEC